MDDQLVTGTPAELLEVERPLSLPRPRVSARTRELALYGAAAVSYVAIGVFVTEFALSWIVGFIWLMLWAWGLPALLRRLRQ
jgi:hypothetical protein